MHTDAGIYHGKVFLLCQVYEADLADHPTNPWALTGLVQLQQAHEEAAAAGDGGNGAARRRRRRLSQDCPVLSQLERQLQSSLVSADKDLKLDSSCPAFSDT